MNFQKYRKLLLSLVLFMCVALIVIVQRSTSLFGEKLSEEVSILLQFAEVVGIIFTILFTIQQLYGSKEIARATFIMELNQNYVENEEYMRVYNTLQSIYDDKQEGKLPHATETKKIEKGAISNYLTFFETIYILKNRGVISFDIVDDLFAYRFFLAVHSELFQKMKLGPQPENFKNIFKLEKEWLEYRVSIGKNSKEELKEAVEKCEELKKDPSITVKWKNVYVARPLRGLVDKDEYDKLVQ